MCACLQLEGVSHPVSEEKMQSILNEERASFAAERTPKSLKLFYEMEILANDFHPIRVIEALDTHRQFTTIPFVAIKPLFLEDETSMDEGNFPSASSSGYFGSSSPGFSFPPLESSGKKGGKRAAKSSMSSPSHIVPRVRSKRRGRKGETSAFLSHRQGSSPEKVPELLMLLSSV
jgi:hypothetical protein